MKFSLPGQMKGPECRRVMQQAIALRKRLEPWFDPLEGGRIFELAVILRVDGSLGSFGPEAVENIAIENGLMECDVVIADHGWADLSDEQIGSILRTRVIEAVDTCLTNAEIPFDAETLDSAVG